MKIKTIMIIVISSISFNLFCQNENILEFNNKPIVDILLVLGELSNKNLIVDETVNGSSSYYFSTDSLDEALNLFLKSQNLFITPIGNAYKISKIKIDIDKVQNIDLSCRDSNIQIVLDNISLKTGLTILYDPLPTTQITLNIKSLNLNSVLDIILLKLPGYTLDKSKEVLFIKKIETIQKSISKDIKTNGIILKDGKYSVNLEKVRFSQVLSELFKKSGAEYSIQGKNDLIIDSLFFKDKTFSSLLNLILEGGNCDYVISNNIYYIFDLTKNEISNRHINTTIIKLKYLTVSEFLKLVPGSFLTSNVIKTDENSNSVIVYGTEMKTEPVINFIQLIDVDKKNKPRWIKMNFVSADLLKTLLLKSYNQNSIINVDENSFLILLTDEEYIQLLTLKEVIDIPPNSHIITLKYLKSEDLLENLPNYIDPKSIVETANPSVIIYYGENESYHMFLEALNSIDKPIPQIKYKVLVLQNTLGDNSNFGLDINSHSENNGDITLPDDEWNAFSGALGSLMNLNFNVLSAFGPLFSFELNASIQESKTKVLVDTTLQGLSGKKVSFRNTTTSRFYQTSTNADGETETGSTQEVSWGIILDIKGWSSGDGMVTVSVESTISDETTVSGENSGIPSTSEKIVNTEIRTREGEPVVIGGLISSKKETSREKTPILGNIPLLGLLFTKNIEYETQSEFVIYLIPYIETTSPNNDEKIKRAYKELQNL